MKRLVAAGFFMVFGVEVLMMLVPDRRYVLAAAGIAVGVAVLAVRWVLVREGDLDGGEPDSDDAAKSLRRWLSRTETLIGHSESTRANWDRHLRPMLARQFELATGQKRAKNRRSFQATGEMLFGTALWAWVDPENVSRSGGDEPGPGRAALDEILQRLERV